MAKGVKEVFTQETFPVGMATRGDNFTSREALSTQKSHSGTKLSAL